MKVAVSWIMFGDPFHIRYFANFLKLFVIFERHFLLTFPMAYLAFLYFCDPTLVLKARAVTNPFPDLPNFPFDSEYVVFILFRLSNFAEIFKVTILSLTLISLCFLTLRRPQFFIFTDWKNLSYLWNFPPRTSSEWSNHDKQTVVLQLLETSCWYRDNFIT